MPTFTLPQFGIFAQGTHAHHFLEFDLRRGVSATDAIDSFRRLRTPDVSAGGVNLGGALGAAAGRGGGPLGAPAALPGLPGNTGAGGGAAPAGPPPPRGLGSGGGPAG